MISRCIVVMIAALTIFANADLLAQKSLNILVYPFEHKGGGKHSWLSSGMTDSVISDLNRVKGINVFSEEDRKKAIREIEMGMTGLIKESDIVGIGKIMGANLIFTGNYSVAGNRVRVTAKIVKVSTSKIESTIKLDDTLENIFPLQDRIVAGLLVDAEKLGLEGFGPPRWSEKDLAGTGNPAIAAYEWYSKALAAGEADTALTINYCEKALGHSPKYFEALNLMGWAKGLRGDRIGALDALARAEKVLDEKGMLNSFDRAMLGANRGIIYWNGGDYHGALKDYRKAADIFENLGRKDTGTYASLLTNMGSAYRSLGDLRKALDLSVRGKDTWERLGLRNTSGYAWTLSNVGIIHQLSKEHVKALNSYDMALKTWDGLGLKNSAGYALTSSQMGAVYNEAGEYRKALHHYTEGTGIADRVGIGGTDIQAWHLWNLSVIYFERLGDPCSGIRHMEKSAGLFRTLNHAEAGRSAQYLQRMKSACRR